MPTQAYENFTTAPMIWSAERCQATFSAVAYPGILFGGGGVQQIQLRTEDRQNWDLGAVAP